MRQRFKNLDTWRGKLNATCACLAPPTAMVAVFVVGGVTSNTFIVDAHALAAPRQDAVFDDLANSVPTQPGVDGSLPTQAKSTIEVPFTGTTDGTVQPVPGVFGDASGIPGTVLAAYQKAARDLALSMPGCHITWPLLAGIGKVESDHASGGKVDVNGNTRGKILGPVLDGGPGMAAIADTDQGVYDGSATWDRAVGPMQFIPSTWSSVKVDADGDGQRNPQDIDDASLASGVYLCSGDDDLGTRAGQEAAVFRYNHSRPYVDLVLRIMEAYSQGDYTAIPSGTYGGTVFSPSYSSAIKTRQHKAKQQHSSSASGGTTTSSGGTSGGTTGGSTGGSAGGGVTLPGGDGGTSNPINEATKNLTQTLTDATGIVSGTVEKTLSLIEAKSVCSDALGPLATNSLVRPLLSTVIGDCAQQVEGKTQAQADSSVVGILNNVLKSLLGALAPKV